MVRFTQSIIDVRRLEHCQKVTTTRNFSGARKLMAKSTVEKRLGIIVRRHREQLGLSQEGLAELTGLHRTYISDIERGVRNLSLRSIIKIAAGLQISIATLFSEFTDSPESPSFVAGRLLNSVVETRPRNEASEPVENGNQLRGVTPPR